MNVLQSVLGVFTGIGEWLVESVTALQPMFWNTEGGLTFLGTLGVAGLAFSVIFLIIGVIQNFLHFRG